MAEEKIPLLERERHPYPQPAISQKRKKGLLSTLVVGALSAGLLFYCVFPQGTLMDFLLTFFASYGEGKPQTMVELMQMLRGAGKLSPTSCRI